MRADRRRIGDHLILEARVELHVPNLVHELARQVAPLLLVLLSQYETAELGGDSLLGDHHRAEREVEEVSLCLVEPGPARWITSQVDVLGGPMRVLPVAVELLRVLQREDVGLAHAERRARMIAEPAWS